jgi:hypothetical protein
MVPKEGSSRLGLVERAEVIEADFDKAMALPLFRKAAAMEVVAVKLSRLVSDLAWEVERLNGS